MIETVFEDTNWTVRVTGLPQAVADACHAAGLSPNAMELHDLSVIQAGPSASGASVTCPSYFCDRTGFVLVLAHLVRNHLPFELELLLKRDASGNSTYRLHPALDSHTRALLAEINPRDAEAIADLQDRASTVFARLRHGHLIEGR